MSIRKLASVQVISNLRSIEGADRIELARILGWNVVVKKGDFKVGDKVIFSKYAGNEVKLEDEEYIIVKQNDILAIVE